MKTTFGAIALLTICLTAVGCGPQDYEFSGGQKISAVNSPNTCTSGFSATKGGQSFMITAGHCGNELEWFRDAGGYSLGVSHFAAVNDVFDAMIIPTTDDRGKATMDARGFQVDDRVVGGYRAVTGVAYPTMDMRVCWRGGATNRMNCGKISGLFPINDQPSLFCIRPDDGVYPVPGDSGAGVWREDAGKAATVVGLIKDAGGCGVSAPPILGFYGMTIRTEDPASL